MARIPQGRTTLTKKAQTTSPLRAALSLTADVAQVAGTILAFYLPYRPLPPPSPPPVSINESLDADEANHVRHRRRRRSSQEGKRGLTSAHWKPDPSNADLHRNDGEDDRTRQSKVQSLMPPSTHLATPYSSLSGSTFDPNLKLNSPAGDGRGTEVRGTLSIRSGEMKGAGTGCDGTLGTSGFTVVFQIEVLDGQQVAIPSVQEAPTQGKLCRQNNGSNFNRFEELELHPAQPVE